MLLLLKLICPLSKAELTTLFGKFKEQLNKKSPVIILKDEPEESYAITHEEQKPAWANDLQVQLNSMQNEIEINVTAQVTQVNQ